MARFDDPFSDEMGRSPREGWDTAQVCLNGHATNEYAQSLPQFNALCCPKCGVQTITKCPKCNSIIRGKYNSPGVLAISEYTPPHFCYHCGNPYPWTEKRLGAAREYVRESDRLSENEKGILERSLDDLVRDTPSTPVSALRYKQLVSKMGSVAADGLKSILYDVLADVAKRQIWP